MNEFYLFKNLKRWLVTYGTKVLDLLIPVENEMSDVPNIRYNDLVELVDKHFNLLAYYAMQPQPNLPFIAVSFEDQTGNSCFPKTLIKFDVYFQVISPSDCKDDRLDVCNSPECILAYREAMNCALAEMVEFMGCDLKSTEFDGELWQYPINYEVTECNYGNLTGVIGDEILHFQTTFSLSENDSCC